MSTEWIQIIITLAIVIPLTILTGRYLLWQRWDKERRINRLSRRRGLDEYYAVKEFWGTVPVIQMWGTVPTYSVKVPCE